MSGVDSNTARSTNADHGNTVPNTVIRPSSSTNSSAAHVQGPLTDGLVNVNQSISPTQQAANELSAMSFTTPPRVTKGILYKSGGVTSPIRPICKQCNRSTDTYSTDCCDKNICTYCIRCVNPILCPFCQNIPIFEELQSAFINELGYAKTDSGAVIRPQPVRIAEEENEMIEQQPQQVHEKVEDKETRLARFKLCRSVIKSRKQLRVDIVNPDNSLWGWKFPKLPPTAVVDPEYKAPKNPTYAGLNNIWSQRETVANAFDNQRKIMIKTLKQGYKLYNDYQKLNYRYAEYESELNVKDELDEKKSKKRIAEIQMEEEAEAEEIMMRQQNYERRKRQRVSNVGYESDGIIRDSRGWEIEQPGPDDESGGDQTDSSN